MADSFDVIIIGAGSAGLSALRQVRKHTESYALINDGPYGTTCARVGCMPSKALIEAANAFHARHAHRAFGISGSEALTVDVPAVLRRVRSLRDRFVAGTLQITDELDERNISGRARLLGPNRVEVNGRRLEARSIVLATGSRPVLPEPWRKLGGRVLTTDTLFEQTTLPRRMGVIGTGAIGIEMAQALSRLGLDVRLFGLHDTLAGVTDPAVNTILRQRFEQELDLHTGNEAKLLLAGEDIVIGFGGRKFAVDSVLVAIGRRPNLDGLGLETLGVPLDDHGMPPFDASTARVADLPVFIAGDASGRAPLLHEAADEGHIAGLNAVAEKPGCFQRRTPIGIVFADPGIAFVGQRFAELDQDRVVIGQVSFENQGRARTAERNYGLMRIYAGAGDGRLLGAEMCVPAAEHMAHLLALAIGQQLTVQDLLRLPFYHPVLEEGLRTALRDLAGQLATDGGSDLASCAAYRAEALD